MKKYEQYKKLIMFLLGFFMVVTLTAVYGYVWHTYYLYLVVYPFLGKGNLLVIVIYGVLLAFFLQVYSGYKFGYLKLGDLILLYNLFSDQSYWSKPFQNHAYAWTDRCGYCYYCIMVLGFVRYLSQNVSAPQYSYDLRE